MCATKLGAGGVSHPRHWRCRKPANEKISLPDLTIMNDSENEDVRLPIDVKLADLRHRIDKIYM